MDEGLLLRVKGHLLPQLQGLRRSGSRGFRHLSVSAVHQSHGQEAQAVRERALDEDDFVALFIDGKSFAEEEMVISGRHEACLQQAGRKVPLGFVEAATENERIW